MKSPLSLAIKSQNIELVKFLLEEKDVPLVNYFDEVTCFQFLFTFQ